MRALRFWEFSVRLSRRILSPSRTDARLLKKGKKAMDAAIARKVIMKITQEIGIPDAGMNRAPFPFKEGILE
jgi:hypothetical protein